MAYNQDLRLTGDGKMGDLRVFQEGREVPFGWFGRTKTATVNQLFTRESRPSEDVLVAAKTFPWGWRKTSNYADENNYYRNQDFQQCFNYVPRHSVCI